MDYSIRDLYDLYFSYSLSKRGKGHNKKAHKNNYKQKLRKNKRR